MDPASGAGSRAVLVADLHLGLGEGKVTGLPARTTARELTDRLLDLVHAERAKRLIVLGDVKHPIVGTPPALRPILFDLFSTLLSDGLGVEVVLGNHDVGLVRHLPREVEVHPGTGTLENGVGLFHGHRWPSSEVLAAPRLVVGHLHPGFRLAPTAERPSGKESCWIRVRIPPVERQSARERHAVHAREIIVLPAFNPLAGVEALNRDKPRRSRSFLFRRFLQLGECRGYLLDGTDLGPVVTTRGGTSSKATPAPVRAR